MSPDGDRQPMFGVAHGDYAAAVRRADLATARAEAAERALAEALEVVGRFAEIGEGLERRETGGWWRVDRWGRKEVILDLALTDLEPLERAAAFIAKHGGKGTETGNIADGGVK
jgi:hypothetical protein